MDVYKLFSEQRLKKGLTQEEVAKQLNIETKILNKYETRELNMDIELFLKIANILDIEVSIVPNRQKKEDSYSNYNIGIDEDYIKKVESYPNLTIEEEKILWKRIEKGEEEAKKQLTLAYSKSVIPIVEKYIEPDIDPMDLVNEGNIGLMKAVEQYDATKGFEFSTYVIWWIRQAITRKIADHSKLMRIPKNMDNPSPHFKVKKIKKHLENKLNREPSIKEIAIELNLSEEIVKKILSYSNVLN